MRSPFANLAGITLPAGAPPGTSRTFIGTPLPPPLDGGVFTGNIFAPGPYSYTGGIIFYGTGDDTTYTFLCQTNRSSPAVAEVHMGHVVSGAVLVDAFGSPEVQSWTMSASQAEYLFTGDVFQVEIGAAPSLNALRVQPSGISIFSQAAALFLQAAGLVTLESTGNNLNLRATAGNIEIAGGNMDVDASPRVGPGGSEQNAYLPYGPDAAACSGTTTITGTTAGGATAVPNCSITVNVFSTLDVFWVDGIFDALGLVAAPASVLNGILTADGTIQTPHATFKGNNTQRATCPAKWKVTGLSPGNRVFSLSAFSATGSEYAVAAANTTISVDPRYHK